MKKILISFLLLCLPMGVFASSGGAHIEKADFNPSDKHSLRRGAKLFMNYCLSCHSASYMRYNRMGKDLGMSDKQVEDNLMFIASFEKNESGEAKKIGQLMTVAMTKKAAKQYFGTVIPDLTVIERAKKQLLGYRGSDWLYTYLTSFYADESRPFGVNNTLSPNVAMPHVLWELEGIKRRVEVKDENGKVMIDDNGHKKMEIVSVTKGTLSDAAYKVAVNDLVNYMVYMAEPIKSERQSLGIFVMFFLLFFFIIAYFLKKEYWTDVH